MRNPVFFLLLVLVLSVSSSATAQEPTPLVTRSEAELLTVLDSAASRKDKADACRELSVIGTRAAVPVLVELLTDPELSHMARYALQTLPEASVGDALRDALKTAEGRQLLGVISSLGARGDPKAVRPLVAHLAAADSETVQAAARALGRIGGAKAADALMNTMGASAAGNALAIHESLLRCAEGLVVAGEVKPALNIYVALREVPSADHQVRAAALRGLILNSARLEGLKLLRQALSSEDYVQAAVAVRSAQELAGADVTAALTADLARLSTDRQVLVIDTLAYRGDVAALPALQAVVRDGEPTARRAAVEAMAGMREPDVVPVLVEWVQHSDSAVAGAALESLAALRFPGVDAAVMTMVNSATPEQRLIGLELVGRRYMVEALPATLRVAETSEGEVRVAALRRIGELGSSAELTALLALLARAESSGDRDALEQALTAIAARTSPPEVISRPVTASLAKASPMAQAVLLRVLGVAGGAEALKQVRASVASEYPEVHTAALRTLSTWKTVDAVPELLALAKASEKPADRALSLRGFLSWVRNSDLAVDQRLSMSADVAPLIQSEDEKKQFLGAVGSIPSERALAYVTPHLEDEAIKEEAAAAVASIAEPMLKRPTTQQAGKDLTAALKQAVESNPSDALKNRLQTLLKEAQSR